MRDFLQMTDPMPLKLGAKVEKPKEQTAEQEAQDLRELAQVVFEALPHNICGQPDVGQLFQRKPVEPAWVEWGGGDMPTAAYRTVELKFRSGQTATGAATMWDWLHEPSVCESDIVAYRVIG